MEVKEAIEFIERYRYARNSKTDEIIDLLKSLEAENKALKILKQAQKDEDKKEHIRYQTIYRLKKENKKLKGYKRILEELKNNPFEGGDIDILINRLEKKYLKGEKNE